jgi:hypothetical protein
MMKWWQVEVVLVVLKVERQVDGNTAGSTMQDH